LDAYNTLYKNPDLVAWGRWFDSAAPQLYPYITEFIARAKKDVKNKATQFNTEKVWDRPDPLFKMNVAYAPMKTAKY